MRNAAIGFLMFVLACPICAVAQLPSASDCDQLREKAGKLIMVLQNAKTKWQEKKGWQEAPDLAMQLNGCKTLAMMHGDLTMLSLYADDQMYLMVGAFDALHSAANDLGAYGEKIFEDYNKVVAITEKCSRSRQYMLPPIPPPPIRCNSFQLGNSISTTCQ